MRSCWGSWGTDDVDVATGDDTGQVDGHGLRMPRGGGHNNRRGGGSGRRASLGPREGPAAISLLTANGTTFQNQHSGTCKMINFTWSSDNVLPLPYAKCAPGNKKNQGECILRGNNFGRSIRDFLSPGKDNLLSQYLYYLLSLDKN